MEVLDGGGRSRKQSRADRQPDASRPNMLTVPETDFTVKETNPDLGKAVDYNHHYDLVEQMAYLFVRVVRARELLGKDETGFSDPVCAPHFYYESALVMKLIVVMSPLLQSVGLS